MATFVLSPQPWLIFLDGNFIMPAGQLAVYEAGTSTPAPVYADVSGTPHPFPITFDGDGRVPGGLYLQQGLSYKFVLHQAPIDLPLSGAVVKTQDNVSVPEGGGGGGGGGGTSTTLDILGVLGVAAGVGQLLYLSDGTGGATAGFWFQTSALSAESSTLPVLGFLLTAGDNGNIVSIRLAGAVDQTGLIGGLDYYVSADGLGVLTDEPPFFARYVGRALNPVTLIATPNPSHAAVLEQTHRINAAVPYRVVWPPTYGQLGQALTAQEGGNLAWANLTGDVFGVLAGDTSVNTVVFLSDGSNGLTAGLWYPASSTQAHFCVTPIVGISMQAGLGGGTIPIRLGGELNFAAAVLLPGADYYIGTVAGSAVTVPPGPPEFARFLGRASSGTRLILSANPPVTAMLQRTTRLNVAAPYDVVWPSTYGQEEQALVARAGGQLAWANLTGDVRGVCGTPVTANNVVFMSDGSASLIAGLWYQASSAAEWASVAAIVGISLHNGNIGDTIQIRLGGELNLTGDVLLTGADYYVGPTPGSAVTAPPPPPGFARFLGRASSANRLIVSANPPATAMVQRSMRVNAPVPYQLVWPPDDGAADQLLKTDGAGNLTWGTPGAVGAHAPTHHTGGSDPLTALSASILLSGTLPDARLTANVLQHAGGYPGGAANFLRSDGAFAAPGAAPAIEIDGVAGEVIGSMEVIYLSSGVGGTTLGRWYRATAAVVESSLVPVVGFALSSAGIGAALSVRTSGAITLAGLVAGSDYYIGNTSGTLTTAKPPLARAVGRAASSTQLVIATNPPTVAGLQQFTRINSATPYLTQWPAADGFAGAGLRTDGAGNLSWGLQTVGRTITATGSQPAIDASNVNSLTFTGAGDLAILGMTPGVEGQHLVLKNRTAFHIFLNHNDPGAPPANRLITFIGGQTPLVGPRSSARFMYTGNLWYLVQHSQGAAYTPPYAPGSYTAPAGMTWTVEAADVVADSFFLNGIVATFNFHYISTSCGGTVGPTIHRVLPLGWSAFGGWAYQTFATLGGSVPLGLTNMSNPAVVAFQKSDASNWPNVNNTVNLIGQVTIDLA